MDDELDTDEIILPVGSRFPCRFAEFVGTCTDFFMWAEILFSGIYEQLLDRIGFKVVGYVFIFG